MILAKFAFCEVRNAAAIVASTSPDEWNDIVIVLGNFSLESGDILGVGGNKSDLAAVSMNAFANVHGAKDVSIL